jgi:hypothetical protein
MNCDEMGWDCCLLRVKGVQLFKVSIGLELSQSLVGDRMNERGWLRLVTSGWAAEISISIRVSIPCTTVDRQPLTSHVYCS